MPSPGDIPNPGIKPTPDRSPALAGRFFTTSATWEAPSLACESESHSVVSDSLQPHGLQPARLLCPLQEYWSGLPYPPPEIFPIQGSNPGVPQCRQILYHLSHQGSPWILDWVAYPFSKGSSWPRNQTGVSWITGRFFTNWAIREAPTLASMMPNGVSGSVRLQESPSMKTR